MFKNLKELFVPNWFGLVNRETVLADFWAGLTGAILVLPQSIAFAIVAGVSPVYGLYSAMVTPVIAALFGSSLHMVSGPAMAISLAIYASLSAFHDSSPTVYLELVLLLTLMVGLIQFLFGFIRLGKVINFVSHSVVTGFTAGAAFLIMNSQIKHIFGIKPDGNAFHSTFLALFEQFHLVNWRIPLVAGVAFLIALILKKISKKIPYLLISMVVATVLSIFLGGEAAGIKIVGKFSSGLPPFYTKHLSFNNFMNLIPGAFAVALLGLIEALAIAKSIGLQSGQRIDANKEFVGQGLSNIIGSFFSSFVGSGSFTRSALNYSSNARTPLSAIFASLLLLLTVLFIAPYAAYLPIPAMGGIILLVGFGLIDFKEIRHIIQSSRMETIIVAVTFFSTLFIDLEYAILLGVATSLVFFLQSISAPNLATMVPDVEKKNNRLANHIRKPHLLACPQLKIIRIDGPIFYGSIDHISTTFEAARQEAAPYCLILAAGVNFIGLEGAHWLEVEAQKWKEKGGGLYIANLKLVAQDTLIRGGYRERIGIHHFFKSKPQAIHFIYSQMNPRICAACENRVFRECQNDYKKSAS